MLHKKETAILQPVSFYHSKDLTNIKSKINLVTTLMSKAWKEGEETRKKCLECKEHIKSFWRKAAR